MQTGYSYIDVFSRSSVSHRNHLYPQNVPKSTVNLWGFERITNGIGKGGYARFDFFSRENPDEIIHIKRRKIKNTSRLMRKKKNAVNIVGTTVPQTVNIDNINSMNLKHLQSSSTASIVSHNYSDVSSISSDSDSEHPSSINDDFSPVPIFEITKDDECPQTGDCLDFEGRSYFFVDEEEVEATRISPASKIVAKPLQRIQTHTTAAPITLCPSSIAGIALYREFFSRDIMMQRFGSLQTS